MTSIALPTTASAAASLASVPARATALIDVIAVLVPTPFDLGGCDFTDDGLHSASHGVVDGTYVLRCDDCGFFA